MPPAALRSPILHQGASLACALGLALFSRPALAAPLALTGPATLLMGDRPHLRVSGARPWSEVTVETWRTSPVSVKVNGGWTTQHPTFHAQAQVWADAQGDIDLDQAPPVSGTYSGADPRGLLWSGAVVGRAPEPDLPPDDPDLKALRDSEVLFRVRVAGRILTSHRLTLKAWKDDVRFETVDTPGLVGVFAAPSGVRRAPTVILLHGSEGGDFDSARKAAGLWASHGYAAFALIYFSWPYEHVPNAPRAFAHLPVERIASARDWLSRRPEADATRLALVGGSKGAEFGLLASSVYLWIKAVVACVPSSVVWGGFGAPLGAHPESFTLNGKAVPYIAYGDYGPVERGEITSAQRHQRDRAVASSETVEHAIIPLERSHARVLLISGGRDAVWPSDAMSAEIVARMQRFGRQSRLEWISNPDAGHYQCGTGEAPVRWYEHDEPSRGGGLVSADGRAPGAAWERTLAFVQASLGKAE